MPEKDTETLENELTNVQSFDDIKKYLATNEPELRDYTLSQYLNLLLKKKQLKKADVARASEMRQDYVYHIFDGQKHPGRPKVLELALAMHLNVKEAQHLLYYAGAAPLYARNAWDSAIIFALQKHASVADTNAMLQQLGEPTLPVG